MRKIKLLNLMRFLRAIRMPYRIYRTLHPGIKPKIIKSGHYVWVLERPKDFMIRVSQFREDAQHVRHRTLNINLMKVGVMVPALDNLTFVTRLKSGAVIVERPGHMLYLHESAF